jgi:hypothetical protein
MTGNTLEKRTRDEETLLKLWRCTDNVSKRGLVIVARDKDSGDGSRFA